jgi:hypothetical protein
MVNIVAPTASDYTTIEYIKTGCGNRGNKNPKKKPTS